MLSGFKRGSLFENVCDKALNLLEEEGKVRGEEVE